MTDSNGYSMLLKLSIQSGPITPGGQPDSHAAAIEHTFDAAGGTLGRSPECDMVLDDPGKYISRIQAQVSFRDGAYLLTILGSNPCLLNERSLGKGQEARLVHQDVLVIGQFVMLVQLVAGQAAVKKSLPLEVPAASPSLFAAPAPAADLMDDDTALFAGAPGSTDPLGLNLFGGEIYAAPRPAAPSGSMYRGAENDQIPPQQQPMGRLEIPADYDPLADIRAPQANAPASSMPAASGPQDDPVLQALLKGLGLPDLKTERSAPELAYLVGALLREATTGTMGALLARSLTKRESRIDVTMMVAQANNPLKFFPDAKSALSQMLANTTGGYMAPERAMRNAFDDLRAHELAVISAMRAAMTEVLKQVSPRGLEQQLQNDTALDKMFQANRKARLWDSLVKIYDDISVHADDDFLRYFGEKFSAAYEEQINRIRKAGK